MINRTNIWKVQVYSERLWKLTGELRAEAGRLGANGKGIAVVAREARELSDALFRAVDRMKTEGDFHVDLGELLTDMNVLIQNAWIETVRVGKIEESIHTSKSIAVALDELRLLRDDLAELLENKTALYLATPEAARLSTVTDVSLQLFQATAGGVHFVENLKYVREIVIYDKIGDELDVRGTRIPVIAFRGGPAEAEGRGCALIINVDWHARGKLYAVPVDAVATNSVFASRVGVYAEPGETGFPAGCVRECWDAAEGKQFVFPDWVKLAEL